LLGRGSGEFDLASWTEAISKWVWSIYIGAFRNAIHVGTQTGYYDLQIGEAFIAQWRNWQAGASQRGRDAAFQVADKVRQIFGFRQLQIHPSNDGKTLVVFVDGKSYLLPVLGAGIAQMIVVRANVAMKNPSSIFIDEPELNLHPTLQRDFLAALGGFAQEGVVFATHSVGLAQSEADLVYSVRRV